MDVSLNSRDTSAVSKGKRVFSPFYGSKDRVTCPRPHSRQVAGRKHKSRQVRLQSGVLPSAPRYCLQADPTKATRPTSARDLRTAHHMILLIMLNRSPTGTGLDAGEHLQQKHSRNCKSGSVCQILNPSGSLGPANKMCSILPELRGLGKKEPLEF